MIIHDFNIVRVSMAPLEADAPLIVDSNAALALSIPVQRFEAICRRDTEILEQDSPIQHSQLSKCDPLDALRELLRKSPVAEGLRFLAPERADHDIRI